MQSHSIVRYKQILIFKQMTTPKFLYQIMKEFKDQTNRRFSNLATTIERPQQTFNVLKHQENLTIRCIVRTCDQTDGLVLGLRLYDCPRHERRELSLTTEPDNELVPGTTVHEAGRDRKQLTRLFVGRRTAVLRHRDGCWRRSTFSDDTARRRSSDFDPDGSRQATT